METTKLDFWCKDFQILKDLHTHFDSLRLFRWNITSGQLGEKISSFEELLAAWQIYNDQIGAVRSSLQDKERDVNALVLQQDPAQSPEDRVNRARVSAQSYFPLCSFHSLVSRPCFGRFAVELFLALRRLVSCPLAVVPRHKPAAYA